LHILLFLIGFFFTYVVIFITKEKTINKQEKDYHSVMITKSCLQTYQNNRGRKSRPQKYY